MTEQFNCTEDYWVDFGYKYAGPIVFAYSSFIYKKALDNNLSKILFVARDGYLIEKVFNIINKTNIKTNYIYASCILTYTANLDYDLKQEEQAKIVCKYFGIDIGSLDPNKYIEDNKFLFEKMSCIEKNKSGYEKYIKIIINPGIGNIRE